MCVYITWAFVNVSPAMAENVRFGLAIHSKNLCFIASLFFSYTFCALIFTCGLATANGIITDAPGWLLPVVPSPGALRLCCFQSLTFCPIY